MVRMEGADGLGGVGGSLMKLGEVVGLDDRDYVHLGLQAGEGGEQCIVVVAAVNGGGGGCVVLWWRWGGLWDADLGMLSLTPWCEG